MTDITTMTDITIMTDTNRQYDEAISSCKEIFLKKTKITERHGGC
ncbi:MAG: hypothetical protein WDN26_14510 [Chitinophagaceae bacterium]